ncbi:hypothetical protein CEXT_332361 [Caerostris extrusa]|uniref:Uncharacterized protein n=1 Tax=Caerostris extrusa TaxID=172846 RepID=A0AAV4RE02_CAEEX|nr:hypothetical protein CEXT_332361 [Caerostris extrusa]
MNTTTTLCNSARKTRFLRANVAPTVEKVPFLALPLEPKKPGTQAVCTHTGAIHLGAGKNRHLLKEHGLSFDNKTIDMTLADGRS